MSSVFSDAHVWDSKFPCCILPHSSLGDDTVKRHVHETVAKVVGWSLHHAARGVAPSTGYRGEPLHGYRKDMAGQTLAAGWKACYFGFRADEKARKETNFFPRSYLHSLICVYCMAQKKHKDWVPELCYKNMHPSAPHRMATISSFDWLRNYSEGFLFRTILQSSGPIKKHTVSYIYIYTYMCVYILIKRYTPPPSSYRSKRRKQPTFGNGPVYCPDLFSPPASPCIGLRLRRLLPTWREVTLERCGRVAFQDCLPWSYAYDLPGNMSWPIPIFNGLLDEEWSFWVRLFGATTFPVFKGHEGSMQARGVPCTFSVEFSRGLKV